METRTTYTTEDEIEFLKNIGRGLYVTADRAFYKRNSRLSLLQKYLRSMDKRDDWGIMDKEEIKKYVRSTGS